jgi:hypothetical protein
MSSSGRGYSAHSIKGVDSVDVSSVGTGPKTAEGMAEIEPCTHSGAKPRAGGRLAFPIGCGGR